MKLPDKIEITKDELKVLIAVAIIFFSAWLIGKIIDKKDNNPPVTTLIERICERHPFDFECVEYKKTMDKLLDYRTKN